jgi:hypothetical protein
MATRKSILRVFLSSPGDLGAQRDTARRVIAQLNADPLIEPNFVLEVVGWDTPGARVPLSASVTPQVSVNAALGLPRDCELTVVLLWGRLGTPLPADQVDAHGKPFASGTVWELEDARQGGRTVWVYWRTVAPQMAIDDPECTGKRAQYEAVKAFVASSRAPDGSLRFGLHEFEDDEELADMLTEHLRHFVASKMKARGHSIPSAVVEAVVKAMPMPLPTKAVADEAGLLPLASYPAGPMIKDILVRALALAIAEAADGAHVRGLFADINSKLEAATPVGEALVRLAHVQFATSMGSRFFWEDVLHWSAMQGPRVLAATLSIVQVRLLEREALAEYNKLVRRVNSYA